MTFHHYVARYYLGNYYLSYKSELTLLQAINKIKKGKLVPKENSPAIVMNRFNIEHKEIQNGVVVAVRNAYDNLECTTGWYALDVDKCGKLVVFVRQALKEIDELKVIWISSSGQGVKAIGYNERLKNLTPDQYKKEYRWICHGIRQKAGMRINFDHTQGRCHQPVFLNHDRTVIVKK